MSLVMRKPGFVLCEQQRRRSAWHPCSLISTFIVRSLDSIIPVVAMYYVLNFKNLDSLCSWAGWFESYLVAKPEDRFLRDEAHMVLSLWVCKMRTGPGLSLNTSAQFTAWHTVKLLKIRTPQKIAVITLKLETKWLFRRVMCPKSADGMANSVDPDQTAPLFAQTCLSDPDQTAPLFAQTCLSETLGT